MILLSSELASSLHRWELAEYISEGFVIAGCAGELVALIRRIPKRCREQIVTWSTVILVLALTIGLKCLMKTNELSGMVIGSLGEKAEQADNKAKAAVVDSSTALSQAKDALNKAGEAQSSLARAEVEAKGAQMAASNALTLSSGARKEADSFEQDIKSAKEQAASAESHLAEALQKAADANRRLGEEESKRAAIEQRIAARRLTAEQKNELISVLKPFAPTMVSLAWTGPGGQESADFASDFNDAILGAGIPITVNNRTNFMDQYFKGVLLKIGQNRAKEGEAIARFLIGAKLAPEPVPTLPPANAEDLTIVIGAKP